MQTYKKDLNYLAYYITGTAKRLTPISDESPRPYRRGPLSYLSSVLNLADS